MADATRWIDEFERDLGLSARLRLIANAGGQTRYIPSLGYAGNSKLASEIGADAARWLAARFGEGEVDVPSKRGMERENAKALLEADILEAGLDMPTVTANEIALRHGVTRRWVIMVRKQLLDERKEGETLPLFPQRIDPARRRLTSITRRFPCVF